MAKAEQGKLGTTKRSQEGMKGLTIKEPWASLINSGKKTIETRKWKTKFRGKILLTASKKPKGKLSGKAFATAMLVDCRPMTHKDAPLALCPVKSNLFAWVLEKISPIKPFPMKGQLKLFNIKKSIASELGTTKRKERNPPPNPPQRRKKHDIKSKSWQRKIKKVEKELAHPICGAKTRSGSPCRKYPLKEGGRCRLHGGKSTGSKTARGRLKQSLAKMTHGFYSKYPLLVTELELEKLKAFKKEFKKDIYKFTDEQLRDKIFLLIIQIDRGVGFASKKNKAWDFSRYSDALIRLFRELKLTPLSRTEVEGMASQADLFVAIRKRLEEREKEKKKK